MTSKPFLALIAVVPSTLQNGLMALMTTTPQISAVLVAEEASLVLRIVKDHRPALIVLDMDFPDAQMLLNQIKSSWPFIRCILLVESADQKSEVENADVVLIKGFTAEKLFGTIEDLFYQGETDSQPEPNSEDGS
jgi:DNA-binding NarL/FixJ family response regulator